MSLIRTQNNVPSIYVDESRDFQILARLYDCVLNGVKYDIDSIKNILDTDRCGSSLLDALCNKVGFKHKYDIAEEDLRYIIKAFPTIIKNKGSLLGIKQCIYVFMKMNNINTNIYVEVDNTVYEVRVGIEHFYTDTRILNELFKYVLPTGYNVEYIFYSSTNTSMSTFAKANARVIVVTDELNSLLRTINYQDYDFDKTIGALDTIELATTEYEGGQKLTERVEGYYYNNKFYSNASHTSEITPTIGFYYIDKTTSSEYLYVGGTDGYKELEEVQ